MRIGIDARTLFQKTGIGRSTRHLLSRIAESDPENEYVVFISNRHHAADFPFVTANTRVVVSAADWMSGPAELRLLGREAVHHGLDVMYFLFPLPDEFPVPFVIKIYDIIPLLFPQWHLSSIVEMFHRQLSASCRAAAAIVASSKATATDLTTVIGVDRSRISVVPEAVQLVRGNARQSPFHQTEAPFALFVGTLEPRKNVRFLFDLWRENPTALKNLRLVIAGKEGWDVEACELAKSGMPGIEYVGYVSDEALSRLYRDASCLVYPSLYEGFGLPVVEAMAAGCPVITSPCGALAEVAADAAIVLDTREKDAWVQSLVRLSSDHAFGKSLSEAGRSRASEFTIERHVAGTLRVLGGIPVGSCR